MSVRRPLGHRRVTLFLPDAEYERLQTIARRFGSTGYKFAQSVLMDQMDLLDDQPGVQEHSASAQERTDESGN